MEEVSFVEDGRPLFVQIAEEVESSVLDGSLAEGERAPSTNELAAFHRINPATAAKGVNLLVDRGILVKRRGLGMFVADGAREILRASAASTSPITTSNRCSPKHAPSGSPRTA